jgi:MFS superfamily sulfate permease-like transporter
MDGLKSECLDGFRLDQVDGFVGILKYKLAWLPLDIFAGLVLTTMLVPIGIAYAVASSCPSSGGAYSVR